MIGIDISDRSIKVVETTDEAVPRLKTMCWGPLAPELMRRGVIQDIALVIEAVRETMQRCSPKPLEGSNVVASIPEMQSFVQVLDMPAMRDEEIDEAIGWAVRRHLPFDLKSVYLDWQAVGEFNEEVGTRRILVGAAQKSVVDPLLAVLDGLELHVLALELEVQAIVRCLLPRDQKEAESVKGILIVDLGATSTNIVFFDQGIMQFSRSLSLGGDELTRSLVKRLDMDAETAIEKKASVGAVAAEGEDWDVSQILSQGVSEWAKAVLDASSEMLGQLTEQSSIQAILLSGGSANLPGIASIFSDVFGKIPVQSGNTWTNLNKEKDNLIVSDADALHFTTALGLALRESQIHS